MSELPMTFCVPIMILMVKAEHETGTTGKIIANKWICKPLALAQRRHVSILFERTERRDQHAVGPD